MDLSRSASLQMADSSKSAAVPAAIATSWQIPTPGERSDLAADRARITRIRSQISELEHSLGLLKEEEDMVQSRLDAYTYPVLTLPNEVISEIFIRCLPVYPRRSLAGPLSQTPIVLLGHVCRQWRAIALATPSLWRAVAVRLDSTNEKLALGLLENHLNLSGSCPLSIKFYIRTRTHPPATAFVQMIAPHCARWEHLSIYYTPSTSLRSIAGPLPLLRSLTVHAVDFSLEQDATITSAFHTAPLLCKVSLQQYPRVHSSMLPWSQLTVLSVRCLDPNQGAAILNVAVNLVTCKFGFLSRVPDEGPR
jgi:hypothetical protein